MNDIACGAVKDLAENVLGYAGSTVGRQVGYLINYKRNLENLDTELSRLSAAKDTVSTKITVAEANGEKIYPDVRVWLENVGTITKQAQQLLKDKQQATVEDANNSLKDDGQPKTKCVRGFCPNPMLRRRRSKNSLALVVGVTELINEGKQLSDISYVPPKGPKDLETEVGKLRVAKDTLAEKVAAAEVKGEKIHANVQHWLKRVAKITEAAEEFLKDKHQSEEATEFSKDEIQAIEKPDASLSHGSKELLELLRVVTELYENREFPDISYVPPKGPKDLETEVGKLRVAKDTLAQKVAAAKVKGEKIHANVQHWLKRVAEITEAAEKFLTDKHQSVEEATEFSKDEIQATEKPDASPSHGSKELLELLQVVTELYENREFPDVSYYVPPEDECIASDEDYEEFDSRTSMVDKILEELRSSSSSDMILVYGVGGVGKTTLVEEVLRKAQKEKLFQDAVMLRDVKVPNLEAIQKQIADKLGLDMSNIQTPSGRANKINERIKNNNTLVIFDDVWGEIDLKAVGLPHKSTCRILLTSRSKQVFSYKIKQKEFPLGVLDDKEARALFEKKAGDVVADPTIRSVAAQVAKKCGGLPVLVITVARALENKPLAIWEDALLSLKKFDGKEELTEKAYSGIKWSYSQLKKQLQPLFLLCGSIAKGNYISLKMLLTYSIGLGFFKDYTVKAARNALDQRVDKLKSSCLLLDGYDGTCVRIHDLVRDVANSISWEDQHALVVDGSHEWGKWPNEDFFVQCRKICLPFRKNATLPQESWKCPQLELFHWDGGDGDDENENEDDDVDSSPAIPNKFFEEMRELKVLGLRCVPLPLLPSSLKFLIKNLQTLCLDDCDFKDTDLALVGELSNLEVLSMVDSMIKQLPQEFGQLIHLRLVDLSDNSDLEVIPAGVISKWTNLEELRLRNSFNKWDGATQYGWQLKEGKSEDIARLSELMDLPKLTALEVHIPVARILPPNFFSDRLEKYQIFLGGWDLGRMDEATLNTVKLELNASFELDESLKVLLMKRCEVFTLNARRGDVSILMKTKVVTSNLTTLNASDCGGLKYLFTSSMVTSLVKLKCLEVNGCQEMEEIVLSTRESHQEEEEYVDIIFAKLESLTLKKLPNLARFCTAGSCIDFPLLEVLHVHGCSKLGEKATRCENVLFDEKVRSPRLEILKIINLAKLGSEDTVLKKIWHNELAPGSFCRLREIYLLNCSGVKSIFPPSMTGRLSGLETLDIRRCTSVSVLFEETNVKETESKTTNLKDGQNLKSVEIDSCHELKYVFPASMVARGLQELQWLRASHCSGMENVVGKEERAVESTKHPRFIFPKVKSLSFDSMRDFMSFYPVMHTSEWPSLQYFKYSNSSMEIFAAEVSVFQETHMPAPTKQPFFRIDKGSFPVLEDLELPTNSKILYGPSSSSRESMFPKLNSNSTTSPN